MKRSPFSLFAAILFLAADLYGSSSSFSPLTNDSSISSAQAQDFSSDALAPSDTLSPTRSGEIHLSVDAAEVTRKIIHAKLSFLARPGVVRLVYPKWVPGSHSPEGPVRDLTGLRFTADGKSISWHRDLVDMYAFDIQVPAGTGRVEAELDLVGPDHRKNYMLGFAATTQLMVLNWNQVLLYPEGQSADRLTFTASIHLPAGWKFGTALPIEREEEGVVHFRSVTLTTLVDSPLIAGSHFREVEITPAGESRHHFLEIAADSDAALAIPGEVFGHYRHLVSETGALFGARHYDSYRFLLALQGSQFDGQEHHQSSDNRLAEMGLVDPDLRMLHGTLLPHEMTHSWNGKYRRPAGLATPDFQQPMKGDLLWVYEGLTDYLGFVLAARSGLFTPEQYRDAIAQVSAELTQPGRTWRPLSDTAVAAQLLYDAPDEWSSWRRGVDFYSEGTLLWLDADTLIRQESQGTKSIDDFCMRFFGGQNGSPAMVTYTFDDVASTLNEVVPYDWRQFLVDRLSSLAPQPPLGGIERAGWRLAYSEQRSDRLLVRESFTQRSDMRYSIGALIGDDGEFIDVVEGSPAAHAGAAPGMKLAGVNNRKYTADVLRQELKIGRNTSQPLELLVTSGQYFVTLQVKYHGGERYPHLERDLSRPDLLSSIIAAKVPTD
jgi:predicted metalloprotease with PDZ domain